MAQEACLSTSLDRSPRAWYFMFGALRCSPTGNSTFPYAWLKIYPCQPIWGWITGWLAWPVSTMCYYIERWVFVLWIFQRLSEVYHIDIVTHGHTGGLECSLSVEFIAYIRVHNNGGGFRLADDTFCRYAFSKLVPPSTVGIFQNPAEARHHTRDLMPHQNAKSNIIYL